MINIPELLNKVLNNEKLSIKYTDRGAYSLGYTLILNQRKIFLKIIPIFNSDNNDDDCIYINLNKKVYNVHESLFHNEIKIQKYVYKKLQICPCIYDTYILDYEKKINKDEDDIIFFINKLAIKDEKSKINYQILINNLKSNKLNKLGLVFMSYMEYTNGNNYFNSYVTYHSNFGKYFLVKDLQNEIMENKINTVYLFILVQIIHTIILLFKNGIIHKDLHLGNVMIDRNEIITKQAYLKNGKIDYKYVGKVYIIDYGYAVSENKINKYKMEYIKQKMEKNNDFSDLNVEENKHIIELIGKKIIKDGTKLNNELEKGWHIYDWIINLLFTSDYHINEELFKKMDILLSEFEKGKNEFNEIKKQEENCCSIFSLFV